MKILILGAAGQISKLLTSYVLEETNHDLVHYARQANRRVKVKDDSREILIDGDFLDRQNLVKAMTGVDLIYLNDMNSKEGVKTIVAAMKETGVTRIIVASILGIYDEVPGAFGEWNRRMVGDAGIRKHKETVAMVEQREFNYTILRLTWLYNNNKNRNYILTSKGEPFQGAQVTREAVAQLVVDIINDSSGTYDKKSIGVGEPGTSWDKPSFY